MIPLVHEAGSEDGGAGMVRKHQIMRISDYRCVVVGAFKKGTDDKDEGPVISTELFRLCFCQPDRVGRYRTLHIRHSRYYLCWLWVPNMNEHSSILSLVLECRVKDLIHYTEYLK